VPAGATRLDLTDLYRYPADSEQPYVRVNFVASLNGVTTVDGVSGGLGSPADKLLFGVLRELADVILVAAGTARAERYRGARTSGELRDRRAGRGQVEVPPIAVVTANADIDPAGPLFTDTSTPPIILTTGDAPAARVERLAGAGADIAIVGGRSADGKLIIEALKSRNLRRVLCEGGPTFFGQLIADDLVDELCLTMAPCLVGGPDQLSKGPVTGLRPMRLASALTEDDGLLLRYVRDRSNDAAQ
jgi:5-amino-6-(5-phosphoribosylamino)uracil reductase